MPSAQHGAGEPETATGSPTVLFTCSLTGTVRAVNAALSSMSGRPLAELPGAPVHTLLHPSCHPRLLQVLRAARGGVVSGAADLCLRRADGSWIELATSWSVLSDAAGDVGQVVFVAVDGTVVAEPQRTAIPPALREAVAQQYALSAALRRALASDALSVEYQPIVDVASGSLVGLEALARWTHPEHGPVPPSSFVGAAELTGLAPALDRWVLRRALRDMAWLRAADVVPDDAYLAVNLSATSLGDVDLSELLAWTAEFGLPTGQLVLEITETAVMQNVDAAARLLRRLRGHGFQVALDDFGTGYSSLAHLRALPISALKVDRLFVADVPEASDARAITASIVELASAVGLTLVAEGVETREQLAVLRQLGVGTAQGWLWGPSVPAAVLLRAGGWIAPLVPASGATATGRWRRDVGVAHGIERLMELHLDGASIPTIASTLDAEGFRTPTGEPWQPVSVARVLAHQIRRCGGAPDPAAARRAARTEGTNPPQV